MQTSCSPRCILQIVRKELRDALDAHLVPRVLIELRELTLEPLAHGHRDRFVERHGNSDGWSCWEEEICGAGERGKGLGGEEGQDERRRRLLEEGEVGSGGSDELKGIAGE